LDSTKFNSVDRPDPKGSTVKKKKNMTRYLAAAGGPKRVKAPREEGGTGKKKWKKSQVTSKAPDAIGTQIRKKRGKFYYTEVKKRANEVVKGGLGKGKVLKVLSRLMKLKNRTKRGPKEKRNRGHPHKSRVVKRKGLHQVLLIPKSEKVPWEGKTA